MPATLKPFLIIVGWLCMWSKAFISYFAPRGFMTNKGNLMAVYCSPCVDISSKYHWWNFVFRMSFTGCFMLRSIGCNSPLQLGGTRKISILCLSSKSKTLSVHYTEKLSMIHQALCSGSSLSSCFFLKTYVLVIFYSDFLCSTVMRKCYMPMTWESNIW